MSFAPVYNEHSRALILGTWPSPKSREMAFYYGDIAALLQKVPIEAVFCNGATAYRIYTKYLQPVTGLAAVKLPSTSPANAACRPEMLRQVWGTALADWITK